MATEKPTFLVFGFLIIKIFYDGKLFSGGQGLIDVHNEEVVPWTRQHFANI